MAFAGGRESCGRSRRRRRTPRRGRGAGPTRRSGRAARASGGRVRDARPQRAVARPWLSSRPSTSVGRERGEDDGALDRLLPERVDAGERQGGPMVPRRPTPTRVPRRVPRPPRIAVPPTTTAATAFSSSPSPALLGTAREANGVQQRGEAGQGAHEREDPGRRRARARCRRAERPRGRSRRRRSPDPRPGGAAPRPSRRGRARATATIERCPAGLAETEPLEAAGQVLHPRALGGSSASASRQATSMASVTMIDGRPRRPTRRPFTAPRPAPRASALASRSGIGDTGLREEAQRPR